MKKTSRHPRRRLLINVFLMALAFGLLGFTIWDNRVQMRAVLGRDLDPRLFALGFAIYMTGMVLTFFRWFLLVRALDLPFTIRDAIRLGFIGNFFNLVIPGAVGGDLIKAAYLSREQAKKTQAIATMIIDRLLGLLGLFLLAGIAGAIAWPVATVKVRRLIVVVWAAVAAGLLVLAAIFGQALTRRFPGLLHGHGRLSGILTEFKVMSDGYRRRLGTVFGCLIFSSAIHALFVLAFYTVSCTLFPKRLPTLPQHFLMVPLTLFTTAVPLPFGALGLSEGVSDGLFRMVSHPGGALAMMGFRVLMYAGGLVSVCFYLANLRQVRTLADSAVEIEQELLEGELDPPESGPEEISPPQSREDQPAARP